MITRRCLLLASIVSLFVVPKTTQATFAIFTVKATQGGSLVLEDGSILVLENGESLNLS